VWREPTVHKELSVGYRLANAEALHAYTQAKGERRRAQRLSGLICRQCRKPGPEWADKWHGKSFCSRACRQKWFRSQSNSYLQRYGLRVMRLHGVQCWWCKRKVQFSVVHGRIKSRYPAPDKRAASIDHLIPRSKGGSNALENLRLVHFGCNWGRYHSRRPEQLFILASGTA
jgi:5-methylcytosine-specific restriction endonuclease McrA